MSTRKRKWDGEYVEVDPSKQRRSESYFQAGSPNRHNFHRRDRFPGRQSEKYELFFGWRSPFSQHHPVKFTVDGKEFNCAEQYYMYRKAALFEDKDIEEKIMNSRDPKEQKRLGKQIQNFDFDTWMQHSKEVVEKGNMAKFSQNPHLKKKLFATAPRLMVEASPYDATWGIALHKYDPRAWDERTWQGQNLLGQIITKVRDNLMRQDGHLDDKEYNSDGSTHRSPVTRKQKTDSLASSSRRDSNSSRSTQRSPISKEQKMDSRVAGSRRDSERDSDCGRSRSPARKKQRTDRWDSYSRRDSEKSVEIEKERKSERSMKKESRRSVERSLRKTDSQETDSDSDSSSSSGDSDRGSSSVMCQTPKSEKHSRKTKEMSRKVGQKKKDRSSSSEVSLERQDRRKKLSDSTSSRKIEDLKGMDRENKTAELCIGGERKKVDNEDNGVVSGRGERQGDTDRHSKERMSIDTDTDGGCMHSKVKSEGSGSGELGGQQQKSHDTEDCKKLSSGVRQSKHGETRSEGQIVDNQRREDRDMNMLQEGTMTEKPLHGGEHNIDVGALETGSKMRKEISERQESKKDDHLVMKAKGESKKDDHLVMKAKGESKKDDHLVMKAKGESKKDDHLVMKAKGESKKDDHLVMKAKGESKKDDHLVMKAKGESEKADERYEEESGETDKGQSEDLFPTVVETQLSDIPHTEHVSMEKMDSENTIADKGRDRSDNESKKVSRDEADDDKSGQETMMKLITDHKMAAVGCGAEEGDGRVEEGKAGHTECQMIHIKPFKKSAQRHYRDNKKVSDTDSGEMDAGSRRSRKHMDSGKRQRRTSGDRMGGVDRGGRDGSNRTSESRSRTKHIDDVSRSNKDLYERAARVTSETRHDIRRDSIDRERSRKRKRDMSRNSGKGSDVRTSHRKESSESSKKDKDMPRKARVASEDDMPRKDRQASEDEMVRKAREASEDDMVRKAREASEDDMVRKAREAAKHKDKDSKDSHDRKVIRGDNSDAREGESPKEHKQRKQNNDNCTSKEQKKKKKKKKAQEIKEKRNKKKAQRKEMRKQRKALQRKRSRSGGQGHDDKGEG